MCITVALSLFVCVCVCVCMCACVPVCVFFLCCGRNDLEIEEARLRREIERFEAKHGKQARVLRAEEGPTGSSSNKKQQKHSEKEVITAKEDATPRAVKRGLQGGRRESVQQGEAGAQKHKLEFHRRNTEGAVVYEVWCSGSQSRAQDFDVEMDEDGVCVSHAPSGAELVLPWAADTDPDHPNHAARFVKQTQRLTISLHRT